ncbi:hypothetical protein OIU78_018536 [Salix suchowensis]|nr:hypothetical protein OIU78_018536 [Salix suchowensis]
MFLLTLQLPQEQLSLAPSHAEISNCSMDYMGVGKTRATLISGDDLLSYSNGNGVAAKSTVLDNGSVGIDLQPEAIAFGTLSAHTASITNDFSVGNDGHELDRPTEGFSSIPDAIEDIRQGKIVVVVDDEDRENEGDLIMAAELATP